MPSGNHRWSRCDDIMVLNLYVKVGRKQLQASDERVIGLSEDIGTTAAAVNMKMANFQAMDPERSGGLGQGSRQSREVWDEFAHNERRLRSIAANNCGTRRRKDASSVQSQDMPPNPLDQIEAILRSDQKLSPENDEILSDIVKTYYQRLASR